MRELSQQMGPSYSVPSASQKAVVPYVPQMTQEIQQDMLSPLSRKPKPKRKRRPELSRGWREANMRLRTKSGNLRKGKTQADVAKLAHKLAKKYKKRNKKKGEGDLIFLGRSPPHLMINN